VYPRAVQTLIKELSRLPGVGRKSAERLALHMVRAPAPQIRDLARAIDRVKQEVCTCSVCYNLADRDPCPICADPAREAGLLCVVETPADLAALEEAGAFKGLYHVLAGALAPLEGVGPESLRIKELLDRVAKGSVREVIIATNPTAEGEATADLVARNLAPTGILVTRLGYGVPVGADLKYMDGRTLSRSLESRRKLD